MRDAPDGIGAKAQALLQRHAPPRHTTLSGGLGADGWVGRSIDDIVTSLPFFLQAPPP